MIKFWPLEMRYSLKGIILLAIPLLLLTLIAHFFSPMPSNRRSPA